MLFHKLVLNLIQIKFVLSEIIQLQLVLKKFEHFSALQAITVDLLKNYASIAEPLISLTRNADNKPFSWTDDSQQAFLHLRQLLIEAPIISYPDFSRPFILQLDASDVGLSAILAQKLFDPDGVQREHVIGYASRTLSSQERRYSPTERECLAIVYGCSHFRPYLEGLRFTVLTDHRALKWLHRTKDLNSRPRSLGYANCCLRCRHSTSSRH